MDNKLGHIFFDLDNTLWDFDANSKACLHELFEEFKLATLGHMSADQFVANYIRHNDRYWALYRENKISKSRLRVARFEIALSDHGVRDKQLAATIGEAYLDQCPYKTKLIDGAREVLDALHGTYHLHILSNGFEEAQSIKLDQCNLRSYFDVVLTSEGAKAKKPSPQIFKQAMRMAGAQASACWMIGDGLDIDVRGAQKVGWKAIHYNMHGISHNEPQVSRLEQLPDLISEMSKDGLTTD